MESACGKLINLYLFNMETNPHFSENAKRDAELVMAVRSGDQKAFARLLAFYKEAIYFMLLRMVNSKSDAEDLTIEAFGKAFTNIHQYEPHYAFSTWLFCIASNGAIDHLRKKRVLTIPLESPVQIVQIAEAENNYNVITQSDNPEEVNIKEQSAKLLLISVASLKPRFRTLIETRYFMDYSYVEIANESICQ
jgi:RNA polymerase sigma-70 factor (ECF subfamily)